MKLRKEFDSIGKINVPADKYWGASTERSKKYFDIGEFFVRPVLIKSIAIIKKSAAIVHQKEKQIESKISNAILNHTGELNKEELDVIKKHPDYGIDLFEEHQIHRRDQIKIYALLIQFPCHRHMAENS